MIMAVTTTKDIVVSQREHPWYQLGPHFESPVSVEEAIASAGLDWTVSLRPMQYATKVTKAGDGTAWETAPDRFAVARDTDGYFMGVVGSHYVPVQNRECFDFAEKLVEMDNPVDAVFTLKKERQLGLVLRYGEDVKVCGKDVHQAYLLFRSSHDGSKAVTAAVIMQRMSCTNQDNMLLKTAKSRWSVPHISTATEKLAEAKIALAVTSKYVEEFRKAADQLAKVDLELAEFEKILKAELPNNKAGERAREGILQVAQTSPNLEGFRNTGWGALNAVAEYVDWRAGGRSREARFVSSTDGVGARLRLRVQRRLMP
jgi:phage/plasmid-like protein (TIGR03299 family)